MKQQIEQNQSIKYLQALRAKAPFLDQLLDRFGDRPVSEYLQWVCQYSSESVQPRQDIADAVSQYVTPLLGPTVAQTVAEELLGMPVVLTANHHGVDYFAQSVQGSLLFSLRRSAGKRCRTVPIFACGNIPLDNITYPRGALVYSSMKKETELPIKLPLFSNKLRRQPVSRVRSIDPPMLKQAEVRLSRAEQDGDIGPCVAKQFQQILQQDYRAKEIQQCDDYSDQSVLLNNRLWQRMQAAARQPSDLVYIELERVAAQLLKKDLRNHDSLFSLLMFNLELRESLLNRLNTIPGCWDLLALESRWNLRAQKERSRSTGTGTFMFWGLDKKNRRIPLRLISLQGCEWLQGCDDDGSELLFPFEQEALRLALDEGRMLPSIFSCFLVMALARGMTCVGGYYQADYLPKMQAGVVDALRSVEGYQAIALKVGLSCCDRYLSGMQMVMNEQDKGLIPAGPIEVIAQGGLSDADLDHIESMTLLEGHYGSLVETLPDLIPEVLLDGDWQRNLAMDNYELLSNRALVSSFN